MRSDFSLNYGYNYNYLRQVEHVGVNIDERSHLRDGARGGGGRCCHFFVLLSFPCSADHERDWPPCRVVLI